MPGIHACMFVCMCKNINAIYIQVCIHKNQVGSFLPPACLFLPHFPTHAKESSRLSI